MKYDQDDMTMALPQSNDTIAYGLSNLSSYIAACNFFFHDIRSPDVFPGRLNVFGCFCDFTITDFDSYTGLTSTSHSHATVNHT